MGTYGLDVYEGFGVTEEEVASFSFNHCGFCGVDMNRVSALMMIQLASIGKYRVYDTFSITDVLQELEGVGRNQKVRVAQFKHEPLKGLWKAHFFDARFLARNLINYSGLKFENNPKMAILLEKAQAEESESPSLYGWQGRLADALTVKAYEEMASKGKLTGEWIIFSKYQGLNYYLGISRHTSREEDENVSHFIDKLCKHEFPFLLHAHKSKS